jgi:hypothetical protein
LVPRRRAAWFSAPGAAAPLRFYCRDGKRGLQDLSAQPDVPAASAAPLSAPACWRMAEIRATSVSTAAGGGLVLDAAAARFWRGGAASPCASNGVWGGTAR